MPCCDNFCLHCSGTGGSHLLVLEIFLVGFHDFLQSVCSFGSVELLLFSMAPSRLITCVVLSFPLFCFSEFCSTFLKVSLIFRIIFLALYFKCVRAFLCFSSLLFSVSLYSSSWPHNAKSSCLSFLNLGITISYHHAWFVLLFQMFIYAVTCSWGWRAGSVGVQT